MGTMVGRTPHIELLALWVTALLDMHALYLKSHRVRFAGTLRILQRNLSVLYGDIARVSNGVRYKLEFLLASPCLSDGNFETTIDSR
jgi:hypothetical protein